MFVQISKDEFLKEIIKKAWYQANIVIWAIIFLFPLFSIIDFIYAPGIWMQFFIARIIIVLIIYILFNFYQSKHGNYKLLLHISFFLLSACSALLCAIVNPENLNVYFLIYSVVILFFNLQVFWEPINSVIQALLALLLLAVFFNLFAEYSIDIFINNGGQYFFIVLVISCLIPNARFKVIVRDVRSQILIEKSNEQLKSQNRDITEKNNIIDMQYEKLRKLDEQKNSFINIAGHDLKNLIGSIIMSNNMVKEEEGSSEQ